MDLKEISNRKKYEILANIDWLIDKKKTFFLGLKLIKVRFLSNIQNN